MNFFAEHVESLIGIACVVFAASVPLRVAIDSYFLKCIASLHSRINDHVEHLHTLPVYETALNIGGKK